jgi:hypothetical protein
MTLSKMAFSPADGLRNTVSYPQVPANESAAREQIQGRMDELQDFINDVLTSEQDAVNTSKADASSLTTHLSDVVTDSDGVHGLKIEEGIFSPTIVGLTTAGTNTYGLQKGFYYVIGNMVHFNIKVALTVKDAAMAGNVVIGGLPFASKNDSERRISCAVGSLASVDLDATRPYLAAMIYDNATSINLLLHGDNTSSTFATVAQITATTTIHITGSYRKA